MLSLDGPEEARRRCEHAADLMDKKFAAARALRGVELVCQDKRIGQFSRTIGAFERSMTLAETGDQACIRAATHKFGFFAMWDQICPAKCFLLQGDFQTAAKLVRYMVDYPHVATCFWTTTQLVLQAAEVFSFSRDRAWLEEVFPFLERFFRIASQTADPETGFLSVKLPASVDDPAELGVEGLCWAPCVNGWWHGACRALADLALLLDKPALADEATRLAAKIEASYLPVFFDEAEGYLYCAVNPKTRKGVGIFHNSSTLAMAYPYGARLFQGRLEALAEYQAHCLSHRRDAPPWLSTRTPTRCGSTPRCSST